MPKYSVYDRVWVMRDNRPTELTVFAVVQSMGYWKRGTAVHYRLVGGTYGVGWGNDEGRRYDEGLVHPTREALLKHLEGDAA